MKCLFFYLAAGEIFRILPKKELIILLQCILIILH